MSRLSQQSPASMEQNDWQSVMVTDSWSDWISYEDIPVATGEE
jgi:hypothetical protein